MSQSQSFDECTESLSGQFSRLKDDFAFLKDVGFEANLECKVPAKIAIAFSMWRIQILRLAEYHPASERFTEAVLEALGNGVINYDEYRRLLATALVVQGSVGMSDDNVVLCATEASYTAHSDDIDKPSESASILRKVFADAEVYAALYCIEMQEGIEEVAERRGVALLRGEPPR